MEQIELSVWARGIAEEKAAVALTWTASARRLGMVSAVGTVLLTAVYAATLGLMVASGTLALAGLSGVIVGDMRLRMIGVAGYVGVFFAVALLLAILFHRATPRKA